ncbi:ABC transporter ATP-binding protein, partial [Rhodococcus sp. CX]|nr:ABC transporter ATP-binding protein [Rhodococcus sp. CX]
EQALVDAGHHAGGVDDVEGIVPQMQATPGMPERRAVARRQDRVRSILHTLPEAAQHAIRESLGAEPAYAEYRDFDAPTEEIPAVVVR